MLGWVNFGVASLPLLARVLWLLGYPDQARQRSQEGVTRAQELSHLFSVASSLAFAACVHHLRRERQAVQERAEAAVALATEQGFSFPLALGTLYRGWALAEQGQEDGVMAKMRQGLAAFRATGSALWQPYFLALLAEGCGRVGQTAEGLALLAEALAAVESTEERWYEAELYRLKGELTLQSKVSSLKSEVEEAEASFHQAIEIARRQQAKSLELRTTTSLARLWRQQGRKEEARQILAEIYGWFTEGFDTADLQEAKALLQELSH